MTEIVMEARGKAYKEKEDELESCLSTKYSWFKFVYYRGYGEHGWVTRKKVILSPGSG
jgi:hypothetical protein